MKQGIGQSMDMTAAPELLVCTGCATPAAARRLIAAASEAAPELSARPAACLGVCTPPATLALQQPGRATLIFSGVRPEHGADLGSTARLWLDTPGGWFEDARPCGALRFLLRARIPAHRG